MLGGGGEEEGGGGIMGAGVGPETNSATSSSGGTFASGGIAFGSRATEGVDTKMLAVIGGVVLVALFLLKR